MKERIYNDKYIYKAFNMKISSNIYLPELLPSEGDADVRITLSKIPGDRCSLYNWKIIFNDNSHSFKFYEKNVGKYYIKDGSSIVVDPVKNVDYNSIRLFLLGTAFGALLVQRKVFPIHGSAIVFKGKAIIFTGASGAGKSTICGAFRKRGYEFLTDDIAAIVFENGSVPFVLPSYPQQKMWPNSIEYMEQDTNVLSQIRPQIDKYALPVNDGFCQKPLPLAAIVELNSRECEDIEIMQLSGSERMNLIMNNTYRAELFSYHGLNNIYFEHSYKIARSTSVYRMFRQVQQFYVDKQVEILIDKLESFL